MSIQSAAEIGAQPVAGLTIAELHWALALYGQRSQREGENWCPPPEHIPGPLDGIDARHLKHYRACNCLDDSAVCCDATCPCE